MSIYLLLYCNNLVLLFYAACRKVLEIGVVTWSLATAITPVVAGYMPGLVLSRILVTYSL
jgi:hypothetical protein